MENDLFQSAYAIYKNKKIIKKSMQSNKKPIKDKISNTAVTVNMQRNSSVNGNGIIKKTMQKKPKEKMLRKKTLNSNKVKHLLNTESNLKNEELQTNKLLTWILSPHSVGNFFANYWEKTILHVSRRKTDYYSTILTSEKLDKMLRENPLHFTRNVDIVSYENGKRETHNSEGRAAPAAVWDFYTNGCSVRVLNPQTYNQNIHILLSTLQEYFGTMVGANIYLTPPGSQGFAPHFDDIEAFVLQLEGRKHWKLYKPRLSSDVLARDSSHNFNRDELGTLIKEVTLEAGDLLYFPRGTVHEAYTDEHCHSLHITVSVYQHTAYADLLEHVLPTALKKACHEDIEFRQGLPLNYLRHVGCVHRDKESNGRRDILKVVEKLMLKLVNYVDVDSAADQLGRRFMHDALPPVITKNEQNRTAKGDSECLIKGKILNRAEFTLDVEVRLLRYHAIHLVVEDSSCRIYYCTENSKVYHGEDEQALEIEPCAVPIVQTLIDQYPEYIAIRNLPTDNDNLKLQIIADMWEKELIITKNSILSQNASIVN